MSELGGAAGDLYGRDPASGADRMRAAPPGSAAISRFRCGQLEVPGVAASGSRSGVEKCQAPGVACGPGARQRFIQAEPCQGSVRGSLRELRGR